MDTTCENTACRSQDKLAVVTCFSKECTTYNSHRPVFEDMNFLNKCFPWLIEMYKLQERDEDDFFEIIDVRFGYATNATRFDIIIGVA